jgi:putative ABC transport system ATP-binding protein
LLQGKSSSSWGPPAAARPPCSSCSAPCSAPTSGSVLIDGIDLTTAPEPRLPALRATHLGFIFQAFNLLSALTARQNVELACNLAGTVGRDAHHRATDLLNRVGLSERLGFRPDQLSGGEKQRVAIARALANNPTVLLADEPTANLDSGHGREIARLLRRLAEEDGRSIVIVSHADRLRQVADRVLWLEDGAFRKLTGMVADPVCGMAVEPAANPTVTIDGTTWCSARHTATTISPPTPTGSARSPPPRDGRDRRRSKRPG